MWQVDAAVAMAKYLESNEDASKTSSKSAGKKLMPSHQKQQPRAGDSIGPRKAIAKTTPVSRAAAVLTTSPHATPSTAPKSNPLGMQAVRNVMEALNMEVYTAAFEETGYDDLEFLTSLDERSLGAVAELVGMKPGHAARFKAWLKREAMHILGESSEEHERA
jgi:hypothetical protein